VLILLICSFSPQSYPLLLILDILGSLFFQRRWTSLSRSAGRGGPSR
jgi:hypothetical protein